MTKNNHSFKEWVSILYGVRSTVNWPTAQWRKGSRKGWFRPRPEPVWVKARRQTVGCVRGTTLAIEGLGRQTGNGLATTEVTRAHASNRESPKLCEEKRWHKTDLCQTNLCRLTSSCPRWAANSETPLLPTAKGTELDRVPPPASRPSPPSWLPQGNLVPSAILHDSSLFWVFSCIPAPPSEPSIHLRICHLGKKNNKTCLFIFKSHKSVCGLAPPCCNLTSVPAEALSEHTRLSSLTHQMQWNSLSLRPLAWTRNTLNHPLHLEILSSLDLLTASPGSRLNSDHPFPLDFWTRAVAPRPVLGPQPMPGEYFHHLGPVLTLLSTSPTFKTGKDEKADPSWYRLALRRDGLSQSSVRTSAWQVGEDVSWPLRRRPRRPPSPALGDEGRSECGNRKEGLTSAHH